MVVPPASQSTILLLASEPSSTKPPAFGPSFSPTTSAKQQVAVLIVDVPSALLCSNTLSPPLREIKPYAFWFVPAVVAMTAHSVMQLVKLETKEKPAEELAMARHSL